MWLLVSGESVIVIVSDSSPAAVASGGVIFIIR